MSDTLLVTVIGAGGAMTTRCLRGLARGHERSLRFRLYDLDLEAAQRSAAHFSAGVASAHGLDLFAPDQLAAAVAGAAFVVNGAGPFYKTAGLVRRAALSAGASYMDIDDDVESALDALSLGAAARAKGVALYVGCGASPGLTNLLARDLIDRLETVSSIDLAWCVGDEGPQELGHSVAAHTLHMGAGSYTGWRDGRRVERQSFVDVRRFPLPGLKRQPFYECAHPEAVMLGHSTAGVRDVTCWGALHPAPVNGAIKGVAEAARDARISEEDAIDYLRAAIAGRKGDPRVEAEAFHGMRRQIRNREMLPADLAIYLVKSWLKWRYATRAGTGAIATGTLEGRPVTLFRYLGNPKARSIINRMDVATGFAEAAFFLEAIAAWPNGPLGCVFPEQWATPSRIYQRLSALLDAPSGDWLGPISAI